MTLDKAYVELRGGCLYVYLDKEWPPTMPPIVKTCHRRVNELFEFFREYGIGQMEVGAVQIPTSCVHAAAALAVMLYAADFDKNTAYELCEDAPDTVKALIADAARWSRPRGGPVIDPQYYGKLAAALRELVEVWRDSKKSVLDAYT